MSLGNKHDVLKTVFGFDDFRRGQEQIVDHLLDGKNSLAVMPTGAGKSLTYQVPALVKGGLSLVVSPLVALMQDQVANTLESLMRARIYSPLDVLDSHSYKNQMISCIHCDECLVPTNFHLQLRTICLRLLQNQN